MIATLFALGNAVSGAVANVTGAIATKAAPTSRVLIVTATSALIASASLAGFSGPVAEIQCLALGFMAGVVGAIGLPLCYSAYAIGPVGVVSPVLSGTSTVTVVLVAWIAAGTLTCPGFPGQFLVVDHAASRAVA
jgi:uncharacterized membrane protein